MIFIVCGSARLSERDGKFCPDPRAPKDLATLSGPTTGSLKRRSLCKRLRTMPQFGRSAALPPMMLHSPRALIAADVTDGSRDLHRF